MPYEGRDWRVFSHSLSPESRTEGQFRGAKDLGNGLYSSNGISGASDPESKYADGSGPDASAMAGVLCNGLRRW